LDENNPDGGDGTGAIDHITFNSVDPEALLKRLKEKNLPYRERKVPGMNLFHIFLEDPNGVTLEINYYGDG
jgi:hypothetical protein